MNPRLAIAACTLVAATPAAAEPRFEGDVTRLVDTRAAEPAVIARDVEQKGFYAGAAFGAEMCAGCHADAAAQWAQSAHRFSSFDNPYYRVSVEEFRKEKGQTASRFCGGCHEPWLVAAGLMDGTIDARRPEAQAGVTCLVCHSAVHVDPRGNGAYTAKLTAFSAERGPAHTARLRPALLATSEFCATCHKVGLDEGITSDRWLRGQNDYDAWHMSAIAGQGAASVWRPAATKRCQDCHMPLEPAPLGDAAAKSGVIRSHRFLGANTALPHLRGDGDMLARTKAFLDGQASVQVTWAGAGLVDVVLRARGVGHRFPGGTMDSNEVWLEVSAWDGRGTLLGRSGALDPAGRLPDEAHLVRVQPVDAQGRPLARRDPQHMRGTVFDAALLPSDPQVVRYDLPEGTTRVLARLLYRKFSADYVQRACALVPDATLRGRCANLPVVEIARGEAGRVGDLTWEGQLDLGLALADAPADRAAAAREYLEAAAALAPDRVEPLLGLARLGLRLGRTDDVLVVTDEATKLAPTHPAGWLLRARALLDAHRFGAAVAPAERLVTLAPKDRYALTLAARARGANRDAQGALAAADAILAMDPESEDGHYQRALALRELGRVSEADRALELFDRHRAATEVDLALRNLWRARRGNAPDESERAHTHVVPRATSRTQLP